MNGGNGQTFINTAGMVVAGGCLSDE